jgi:hypothetical protein
VKHHDGPREPWRRTFAAIGKTTTQRHIADAGELAVDHSAPSSPPSPAPSASAVAEVAAAVRVVVVAAAASSSAALRPSAAVSSPWTRAGPAPARGGAARRSWPSSSGCSGVSGQACRSSSRSRSVTRVQRHTDGDGRRRPCDRDRPAF